MQSYGQIITPKKTKIEQGSGEQKKKQIKEWKYVNQFLNMERNIPEQKPELGKDISKEEKERRLHQMYKQLPRHSRSAIKKSLKKHRYDIQETYKHMQKQPQMPDEQPEQKQENTEKTDAFPSQVCDQFQEENIGGEEFQWIFIVAPSKPRPRSRAGFNKGNVARKEQVDEDYMHYTLKDVRDELDHLYKHRKKLQIMKGNMRGNRNPEPQRMINQINPRIASLSRASRILEVQRMEEQDPLWINLHGYRQQQIVPLFNHIVQMLRENPQVKSSTRMANLVAITGKGLHSQDQQSVLKPALKAWCKQNSFQSIEESDRLHLLIPL